VSSSVVSNIPRNGVTRDKLNIVYSKSMYVRNNCSFPFSLHGEPKERLDRKLDNKAIYLTGRTILLVVNEHYLVCTCRKHLQLFAVRALFGSY